MNRLVLISCCLFLVACQSVRHKVDLVWRIPPAEIMIYKATISGVEPDKDFMLDGVSVLDNPVLVGQLKKKLEAFERPASTFEMRLKGYDGGFRSELIAINPEYSVPPLNASEEALREMVASRAGTVEILANLDLKGQLKSFYLKQKQRNIVALFFKLPNQSVKLGEEWALPLRLTEIGQGFVPKEVHQSRKAKLIAIRKNAKGEEIADLFYAITESVTGQFEYSYSDEKISISTKYSYFVSAQFNVNRGRWDGFKAVSYLSGRGLSQNEIMEFYMLEPVN